MKTRLKAPVGKRAVDWRLSSGLFGLLPWLALAGMPAMADDDVLVTSNGDRLTGEVKSLDRGLLQFETDATDTIAIYWTQVMELISEQSFLVTLNDGRQLFGTLAEAASPNTLRFTAEGAEFDLPLTSVVRMTPIEGRLIDRIDMNVNLGYNLTKANNVNQTTFGYDFNYRSEERLLSFNLDASRSSSGDNPTSQRTNSTLSFRRFSLERLWDPVGFGSIERNDELGLDRRLTLGGGMARWLTDTNSQRISFMGGLVATREDETDAIESDESVEAAVGLNLDWFRYDDPEFDVSMQLAVYQRLTDQNRTRGNLDVDLRWEIVSDFFWGFSVYYTFNTEPTGNASSEDYGVVTTIGWSF